MEKKWKEVEGSREKSKEIMTMDRHVSLRYTHDDVRNVEIDY